MTEFEARQEIKSRLYDAIGEQVDYDNQISADFEDKSDSDLRDKLIDGLYDIEMEIMDNMVIYYADGLAYANAFNYWNWKDNELAMEVENASQLGFLAIYEYIAEYGLIYDVVDEYILNNFGK